MSVTQPWQTSEWGAGTQAGSGSLPVVVVNAYTQAAITAAVAEIIAAGGGILIVPPGTYPLYESAGGQVATFIGLTGIKILGYGATLAISTTNPDILDTQGYGAILSISNCTNVDIDGFNVTGPDMSAGFAIVGAFGVTFAQLNTGNTNVSITNCKVQGALAGLNMPNSIGGTPNRNIKVNNFDVSQSIYGIVGYYGLEGLVVENFRTDDIYRSLFLYGGIANVRASVWSKNNYSNDVIILALGSAGATGGVDGVYLNYYRGTDTTANTGVSHCVYIGMGDETPSYFRNVEINLDVRYAGAGDTGRGVVQFIKQKLDATADTVDRGHLVSNVVISGFIDGLPSAQVDGVIGFQGAAMWGPALDKMYNITLRDLRVTHASAVIQIDAGAAVDHVVLENVVSAGPVAIHDYRTYAAPNKFPSSTARVSVRNSSFVNRDVYAAIGGIGYLPYAVRQFGAATANVPAAWMDGVSVCNNDLMGVAQTLILPPAAKGLAMTFVQSKGFTLRLDPQAGEVIVGSPGAGKYLEIDATTRGAVRLECHSDTGGTMLWQPVASYGTITFEP